MPKAKAKKSFSLSAALRYAKRPTMPNWSKSMFGGTLDMRPSGDIMMPFLTVELVLFALFVVLVVVFVLFKVVLTVFLIEVLLVLVVLVVVEFEFNKDEVDFALALLPDAAVVFIPSELLANMLELDEFTLFEDDESCKLIDGSLVFKVLNDVKSLVLLLLLLFKPSTLVPLGLLWTL